MFASVQSPLEGKSHNGVSSTSAAPSGVPLPATSLLARTANASVPLPLASNSSGPSTAQGSHARAYLDALIPPPRRVTPLQRTASTLSTTGYKPQKPSSLASGASVTDSDSDESSEDDDAQTAAALPTSDSQELSGAVTNLPSHLLSPTSPPNLTAAGAEAASPPSAGSVDQQLNAILALLDDMLMDEEDKIDTVRNRLGSWLEEMEGIKPSPFRLDSVVLDLMHRHREDVNPTGTTFPSSPLRRPGSARSFSSQGIHRPFTPTKNSFSGAGGVGTVPTTTGAAVEPPSSSGTAGPSSLAATAVTSPFGSSAHLGGVPAPPRTASPAPANDPGVIGSGSPRGSPRFWAKAPAPLPISSSHRDSFDSTSAQLGSPWGGFSLTSGPTTPSGLSTAFSFNSPSSPFSSVPPGLAPAVGGVSGTSGAPPSNTSAAGSRPPSPSPFNSPRLNVAAAAFKPRTASNSSHVSGMSAVRPSLLDSSSRRSSGQAILLKNHPVGHEDDEEDEFSPFGSAKADNNPLSSSGAGSYYSSSAGSSFGAATGEAGSAFSGDHTAGVDEEDPSSGGMTPFDVLYSILSGAGSSVATQWSPEQIEEALSAHNWDVEATLSTIFENGGKAQPSSGQAGRLPATPPLAPRSSLLPPAGPAGWTAARGGVNVMSRDAFSSFRGGRAGNWMPGAGRGASGGGNAYGRGAPLTPSVAAASPVLGGSGGGGAGGGAAATGPGRVCRYFLSGDCRRADCRFSHDLSKALCKFWLRGQCLNDPCPFLHDQDLVQSLASSMAGTTLGAEIAAASSANSSGSSQISGSTASAAASVSGHTDDFPELPPSGPKADRSRIHLAASSPGPPPGAPTGPAASDPTRSRWANALQRNATAGNPLSMIQQGGDVGMVNVHARSAPISAGRPPLGPRTASSSSSSIANKGSLAARLALRPPTLLPTLSVGKSAASSYASHRRGLLDLVEQRNRCLARASEAFRAGDSTSARKWSSEGQALNAKIAERSPAVARDIVKERHRELQERLQAPSGADGGGWGSSANASDEPGARGLRGSVIGNGLGLCLGVARKDALSPQNANLTLEERTECFLDAHGLHAGEAVEIIEEFLLALEQRDGGKAMRGLVYLAVGSSRHSSLSTDKRRVKLAGAVKAFLASWGYPYAEHDGVLAVDHLTHH